MSIYQVLKAVVLLGILGVTTGETKPDKPFIAALHVTTDIKFHFATTLVTSIVFNPLEESSEAAFDITLPNSAFISNFTLQIEGKVYPASVKEKEEAKREYERAKKKGQSAGHVAARPRETNKFRVEVNVAGGSVVVFNLTYQEVLKRTLGAYESVLYLDPGQPVEDMKIQVYIEENRPLRFLHVPPLQNELLYDHDLTQQNKLAIIDRLSPRQAYILYEPSIAQQSEKSPNGISALFTVRYDVQRDFDAGDLLVVNGYFVHFLAPAVSEPIPKEIIFILDTSSSMLGTKFRQLKESMRVILKDLQEGDKFNIVLFSSNVDKWKNHALTVTQKHIQEALDFVEDMSAGGYTNINAALKEGLKILHKSKRTDSLPIIMFLSDGEPTRGVRDSNTILSNAKVLNKGSIPVYSLAFGQGADWDLSKRLSQQSGAVARKIYEHADATIQMTNFYREVSTTLLTSVKFKYLEDQVENGSLTTSEFRNFFNGSELMVAGKLSESATKLMVGVKAMSISGPVSFNLENDLSDLPSASSLTNINEVQTITEKMWAYLTIKQMIKEMEESGDDQRKAEMKAKATELSLRYNFVTPLTSMVVTKPDEESLNDINEDGANNVNNPSPSSAYGGGDPHFMISIHSLPYPLCFDVKGQAGHFYRLLKDPVNDLVINTNMEQGITTGKDGKPRELMTQMVVRNKRLVMFVSMLGVHIADQLLAWETHRKVELAGNTVEINGLFIRVVLDFGVEVLFSKVIKHNEVPARIDFLNIEIENEHLLSPETNGIIGQFAHKGIKMKERESYGRRLYADLWVEEDDRIIAEGFGIRKVRKNFVLNERKTCIVVAVPTKLFEVKPEMFVIPSLSYF